MRNILLRDTLRSIARNKLRFVSVVIIVALGVSFYVGIKSASPKMSTTANEYFNNYNLLDVRVTSKIPFSEEDILKIKRFEIIDNVVESRYVDAIVRIGNAAIVDNDGMELSCRIGELDVDAAKRFCKTGEADASYMNRLNLTDGRFPERSNECVIDTHTLKGYDSISIGSVLTLSGDGVSVTDNLKHKTLTVVGTVDSPLYISADHGTTQVGSGSLSSFAYVPTDCFKNDECNELFIKIKNSEHYDKFNKLYDDKVSKLASDIQDISADIIDAKLIAIKSDYNKKIAQKEQEIKNFTASSEKQLEEKQKESDDFKKLVSNEDEFLLKEQSSSEERKKATKATLESNKRTFNQLQTKYDDNKKKYDQSSQKIDGYTELKKLYDDLEEKHEKDKKSLDSMSAAKNKANNKVEAAHSKAEKANNSVLSAESKISRLNSDIKSLKRDISRLEEEKASLEVRISELDDEISSLQSKINKINDKIENGTSDFNDLATLATYRSQLNDRKSERKEAQSRLKTVKDIISSKNTAIDTKTAELNKLNEKLPELKSEQTSANNAFSAAQSEYNVAKSSYDTAKKLYDADEETLNKYKKSMDTLTAGQSDLLALQKTIETQKRQLDSMKVTLTVSQINYSLAVRNGDIRIHKAQTQLKEAKLRLNTIDSEFLDLKKGNELKLSELNSDLRNLNNTLKNVESLVWSATSQTNLSGHKSFISSMENIYNMSMIFPLIFLFTAMVACFVIMLKNVEDERNAIGLFKSFGYSPLTITGKYFFYSSLAWFIGTIIGIFVGSCVFPRTIYSIYDSTYYIPNINIAFNSQYIIKGMLVSFVTTTAASCIAVSRELKHYPAVLLRPKAISYNKRSLVETISGLWERMSYGMVLLIRTVSRSRKRVVVGTLAIACCTALILSAFGLLNSASDVKKMQYGSDGIFKYDLRMVLNSDQEPGESEIMKTIDEYDNIVSGALVCNTVYDASAVPSRWHGFDSAHILVTKDLKNINSYVNLMLEEGSKNLESGKAVISKKLASDLELGVGDTIYFSDTDGNSYSAQVGGIVKNYIDHYVYMSEETYENTFASKPTYKYIVCNLKDYLTDGEINDIKSDFLKMDEVTGVTTSENLANSVDVSINQVLSLVILFIASACLLAAIVMYTIANVNISERMHEIANIKVLGFSKGEVLLYVVRENIVSTSVGTILGLIVGIPLHHALVDYISAENVLFGDRILWWSFLCALLIIVAVAVATALPIMLKINKVNVPETLKAVE